MRHRGPDASGIWRSPDHRIALGAVRLAIMAPDDGDQPVRNETGDIRAVVNGEFYDFERLRADLQSRGHIFTSRTDSELLIHLYEERGIECMDELRGEFAFILWDAKRARLVAARDRFGIKPLHFTHQGGEWLFASEVKALVAAGIAPRWDVEAFSHCLTHQYLRPGESFFEGVREVKPAHLLVFEGEHMKEICYWSPNFEPDYSIKAEDVIHELKRSVHTRMRSDVPVACTLSGGLDSSAVASISGASDCFCVRFDGPDYDEGPLVSAEALDGRRVHEVSVTQHDLTTHLEAAVHQSEGVAINGQLVGKYLLSRAIRDAGFKVVLAGEGADEGFLGYAHLQQDYTRVPSESPLQKGVMLPADDDDTDQDIPSWLERMPTFLRAKLATGRHLSALTQVPLQSNAILNETLSSLHTPGGDLTRKSAWLWTRLALAGYILRRLGDGAEMAHSVEARLPFLDHVLFELAAKIPTNALINHQQTKILLRDSLKGVVPDSIRNRKKHPFLSPPLSNDSVTRDFIYDTLHSDDCRSLPLLDHGNVLNWVNKLDQDPQTKRARLDPALMILLTATLLQKSYRMT